MPSPDLLLGFLGFALVASITPGPNNLMLMASGANFGLRRTVPHMVGVVGGFGLMLVLVGIGVGRIFAAVPALGIALKIGCGVYLLYLAYKIATAAPPAATGTPSVARPLTLFQAAAFQWVNPKAWAMVLTAVSVFAPPASGLAGVILIAGLFCLVGAPCNLLWITAGTQMRRFLDRRWRLLAFNITAAILLVASVAPMLLAKAPVT